VKNNALLRIISTSLSSLRPSSSSSSLGMVLSDTVALFIAPLVVLTALPPPAVVWPSPRSPPRCCGASLSYENDRRFNDGGDRLFSLIPAERRCGGGGGGKKGDGSSFSGILASSTRVAEAELVGGSRGGDCDWDSWLFVMILFFALIDLWWERRSEMRKWESFLRLRRFPLCSGQ